MPDLLGLWKLSDELGTPGVQALWLAVRKKKLDVTRAQVEDWVKRRGERQVFAAVQPSRGRTVSENDNRWMMDLIDVGGHSGDSFKFILVCINIYDRFIYAKMLRSKEPREVSVQLEAILREARKKPQFITSDQGNEFKGPVETLLIRKNINQKLKELGDVNAIAVVDRAIGLLKRKLAEMRASGGKPWGKNLQAAVHALNNTPKPEVLHGASPEEVRDNPEIRFMLNQDTARDIQHNKSLTEKKAEALEETKHFRAPLPGATSKFKRGFVATYGDVKTAAAVQGNVVLDTEGNKHALKRVKVVPAKSTAVARPYDKRLLGAPIMEALAGILEGDERMSLTKAAALLREQVDNYNEVLKKTGGKLIDLIRLARERFKLVEMPHGTKTWYYVSALR